MGLLSRSEEVAVLVRLKVAAGPIRREIPPEMHWAFAYEMLQRVSCSLALGPELRNAVSAPSPPFPPFNPRSPPIPGIPEALTAADFDPSCRCASSTSCKVWF
ncbi:hypothetical protein ZWY2020_029789 [Hordeum vulgare]|nr:hypothetical protein ZWY2020_029789 [Hordeum vulgare]